MTKHKAWCYLIYSISSGMIGKALKNLNIRPNSPAFWYIVGPLIVIGFIWLDPLELFQGEKK